MATSSIFHNVVLDTPEKVQAFVDAIDASLADPYVPPKNVRRIKPDEEGVYMTFEILREGEESK